MKLSQTVLKLQTVQEYMTEITIYYVQRAITPKIGHPELWILCSACRLMVLYICITLHENISNSFQVIERTRNVMDRLGGQTMSPHPVGGTWGEKGGLIPNPARASRKEEIK